MARKKTTVLVFGTFDVIHPGHEWFLKKSRRFGDTLAAAVARDTFVREWKGHPPLTDEQARIKALEQSGLVDYARLSDADIRTYNIVKEISPEVICLGHDQKALKDDLERWVAANDAVRPEIVILPPWKRDRYSSTRLNKALAGAGLSEPSPAWALYLLMFFAMAAFGFSWVSGKRISGFAPPAVLALIRFAITACCFIPLVLVRPPEKLRSRASRLRGWGTVLAAATALVSYNIFFFYGLNSGLAGQGGLIVTTLNPLFTFLLVSVAGRKKPGGYTIPGLAIGITGGILLMRPWLYSGLEILDSGNITFMAAALSWSILTILSRPSQAVMGFRRFNLALYSIATLILVPFVILSGDLSAFSGIPLLGNGSGSAPGFWGDMLFISAVTGAFGTGAYFMASSRLGAARGSAFTYLVPVFALVFTSLLLGEIPDPWMLIGGLLAICAVVLINRGRKSRTGISGSGDSGSDRS